MMKHTISKAPENLQKLKDEMEVKQNNIKELEAQIDKIKHELVELEQTALDTYAQIEIKNKENEAKQNEMKAKTQELQELKQESDKLKEERLKIKEEIRNIEGEIKRVRKSEENTNDEIKKNLVSFKKLIDEFGFIDSFEKEVDQVRFNFLFHLR